ncbi:TetR/AcrR family transcriptional regulator [Actinomycetes bacterium KLBMP 9797]
MSPRSPDPRVKLALVDAAARLLATEGPQALTTRRLSAETGSSTMAVYTYFDGMTGLLREVVREGFARLQSHLGRVRTTRDPVADLALLGRAYRHNALANPHLYAAMFGGSPLAGFTLTEEDRQHGRYTLVNVAECTARCVSERRFASADPALLAHQMWFGVHGLVTLELGGYLVEPWTADRCFEAELVALMVGAGDHADAATRSVAASRRRFRGEIVIAAAVRRADTAPRAN